MFQADLGDIMSRCSFEVHHEFEGRQDHLIDVGE
jgi:hypothetical protein